MERLTPIVHRTPLVTSETTNNIVGKHVYFKMENQQKTGAFKFRGATFKLMQLPKKQLNRGVITASAGNHAQGVASAARAAGRSWRKFSRGAKSATRGSCCPYPITVVTVRRSRTRRGSATTRTVDSIFESTTGRSASDATSARPLNSRDAF